MADAPEIPEANDPFEKRVAVTIALLAIVLSFIQNAGDNGQAQQIVKTAEESNQWAYYQAKSMKGTMVSMESELLSRLATNDQKAEIDRLKAEAARYDTEKAEIKKKAEDLKKDADAGAEIDNRSDLASLFLQIAIVICSVAILGHSHKMWWAGIALGVVGVAVGATLGAALSPL
jgi:hypothetical protein